jgi:hypothetical protein
MDGTGDHNVEWNKPRTKGQISCFHSYVEFIFKMIKIIIMGFECKPNGTCGRI